MAIKIKYDKFYDYICELVESFQKTRKLTGISQIAKKHGVKALTKEEFFLYHLNDIVGVPNRPTIDMMRDDMSLRQAKEREEYYLAKSKKQVTDMLDMFIEKDKEKLEERLIRLDGVDAYSWAFKTNKVVNLSKLPQCILASKTEEQLKNALPGGKNGIYHYLYTLCSLCCDDELKAYNVGVAQCSDGTTYFLSDKPEVLIYQSMISEVVCDARK